MRLLLVLALILFCSSSSCTSFRTMSLGRLDNDSLFVNCFNRKAKGIPVKMKVPSHVTVTVYEQQILIRGKEGVKLQSFSPPQYEVETGLAYTDKVFTVDFVRPAGGSLALLNQDANKDGIAFDDEQYFKSIQATVKEQTMEQVANAMKDFPGTLKGDDKASGASVSARVVDSSQGFDNIHFEQSIVAYQRFDLARPHWEEELNYFVNKYLVKCGTCPKLPAAKKVSAITEQSTEEFYPVLPPALSELD